MCRRYRIPHSTLLDTWSDRDVALAVAYEQHLRIVEADTCACGVRRSDLAEPGPLPVTVGYRDCPVCAEIERARQGLGDIGGRHITLHPNTFDPDEAEVDDAPAPDTTAPVVIRHPVTREKRAVTLAEWSERWAAQGWEVQFDEATGNPLVAASDPDPAGEGTVTE